ncbi:MAG: C10 family peptidase [Bacteroidales bacterium]|nr:C10 family peptidase [Bacteroidales bacterium]
MKKLILSFFSGLLTLMLIAQSNSKVDPLEAQLVAVNFINERFWDHQVITSAQFKVIEIVPNYEQEMLLYYAINFENGFVLVAGTRNAWPVLAYSPQGKFSQPDEEKNVGAWLRQYQDQIIFSLNNPAEVIPEIDHAWEKYLSPEFSIKNMHALKSVEPLLTSKWNQGKFYNELCPVDPGGPGGRCYAGCVATAMGQVMFYFRHPQTGMGSYSYYLPEYDTISANFENTTYRWQEMVNQLSGSNLAVAELLFHLGVSVDMVYGPDGSGMYNHKAAYSLRTYFKYAPETQYVYRDSTNMDWDSLLISHLDRNIPMYYAGWSEPNLYGHAFVVDGYQDGGYYHFNWGWGGSYDGYFYTNELTPGGSNFNLAQELIIHCVPDTINHVYPDYCEGFTELTNHEGTFGDGSGPIYYYAANSQCSYLINPQNEMDSITCITLSFQRFHLEEDDYLSIFDGQDDNAPLIGTFSGETIPDAVTSSGNQLFLLFLSNPRGSANGFFASYQTQKPVWCSGMTTLTASEGWISDGSGSFYYNNGNTCMWYINPEGASEVTLNLTMIDTEPLNDVIKVYDPTNNQLLAQFSGYFEPGNLPEPVTAYNGKMFITFTTNSYVRGNGWEAYYTTDLTFVDEKQTADGLFLFPNPASEHVIIKWKTDKDNPQYLVILNHFGVEVRKIPLNTDQDMFELNTSTLTPGLYFIKIEYSKDQIISKLTII